MTADYNDGGNDVEAQDFGNVISPAQGQNPEPGTRAPHPWRRLFARHLDIQLWGVLVNIPFYLYFGYILGKEEEVLIWIESYRFFLGPLIYLTWLPVEALFISKLGTTPTKWCFGISIRTRNREKLAFFSALNRTVQVWIRGDGLGFLPVMLATRATAYNRLTNTGSTTWDDNCETRVQHEPSGYARAISLALLVVAVYALLLFPMV